MNDPKNQSKIAIVVVGYNRLSPIRRLLGSLQDAQYPNQDIPLVISIDCSGCTELYDYVHQFEWSHGRKYVIIQEKRLGLKEHIFKCGDLTRYFKAIILLEDDLFVSPYFYNYVQQAVEVYGDDEQIAEISLYKNERNGYVGLPYVEYYDGNDVFLRQSVSSWGQCWTYKMWHLFRAWYFKDDVEEKVQNANMPTAIKGWERAWSKYFYAYLIEENKYVLYPHVSLSTNFSDAGEHGKHACTSEQVSLLMGALEYRMPDSFQLAKYDVYFNNIAIYDWLSIKENELLLDLYGFSEIDNNKKYMLTMRSLPFKKIKSFALVFRPIELNIKYNLEGEGITLYQIEKKNVNNKVLKYNSVVGTYFLKRFNHKALFKVASEYFKKDFFNLFLRAKNKIIRILTK